MIQMQLQDGGMNIGMQGVLDGGINRHMQPQIGPYGGMMQQQRVHVTGLPPLPLHIFSIGTLLTPHFVSGVFQILCDGCPVVPLSPPAAQHSYPGLPELAE